MAGKGEGYHDQEELMDAAEYEALWNPWESKAPGRRDKQMGSCVCTEDQKQKMLEAMGLSSTDELFFPYPFTGKAAGKTQDSGRII